MKPTTRTLTRQAAALALLSALVAGGDPAPAQTVPRVLSFVEALKGTQDTELRWPVAVAAASSDEIAVADAFGPRLLRFRKVGVSWSLDGQVELPGAPAGLVWDGGRYVASLRQGQGLVAFEGPSLAQRRLRLPRGVVPGALAAHQSGDLLVYDSAGHRALRLSPEGQVEGEFPIEGEVTALAATGAGGVLVAVASESAVRRLDANGQASAAWTLPPHEGIPAWPVGIAVEPGGDAIVVDRHAGRLLVLDAAGELAGIGSRQGGEPGLLLYPRGIARLPDGLLIVADEGNGRAQVFRRTE